MHNLVGLAIAAMVGFWLYSHVGEFFKSMPEKSGGNIEAIKSGLPALPNLLLKKNEGAARRSMQNFIEPERGSFYPDVHRQFRGRIVENGGR